MMLIFLAKVWKSIKIIKQFLIKVQFDFIYFRASFSDKTCMLQFTSVLCTNIIVCLGLQILINAFVWAGIQKKESSICYKTKSVLGVLKSIEVSRVQLVTLLLMTVFCSSFLTVYRFVIASTVTDTGKMRIDYIKLYRIKFWKPHVLTLSLVAAIPYSRSIMTPGMWKDYLNLHFPTNRRGKL